MKKTCLVDGCSNDTHYSKNMCRKHYERDLRARNPEYREKQKVNSRQWTIKNSARKSQYDKLRREREKLKEGYKEKQQNKSLSYNYGITLDQYNQLLKSQGNRCKICRSDSSGTKHGRFHVDHDHKTDKIRGVLCFRCNRALGMMGDTLENLQKFVNYLGETHD